MFVGVVYCVIKYVVWAILEGLWQEVKLYNLCIIIIFLGVVDMELFNYIIYEVLVEGIQGFYKYYVIFVDFFVWVVVYVIDQFVEVDINEVLFWLMVQVLQWVIISCRYLFWFVVFFFLEKVLIMIIDVNCVDLFF